MLSYRISECKVVEYKEIINGSFFFEHKMRLSYSILTY